MDRALVRRILGLLALMGYSLDDLQSGRVVVRVGEARNGETIFGSGPSRLGRDLHGQGEVHGQEVPKARPRSDDQVQVPRGEVASRPGASSV